MAFGTDRLLVRRFGPEDAPFVLALLNDPGFLANIGDRGVRTIADAEAYVRDRFDASWATHGFAMMHVALRQADQPDGIGEPVGMAGFVRRDGLDGPDLGFSFLAHHTGKGYGFEAARALIDRRLDLRPLFAITALDNDASAGLLRKLGFAEREVRKLPGIDRPSRLFVLGG